MSDWLTNREVLAIFQKRFGESWAGFPLPMPGCSMTIHPRFRFAKLLEQKFPDSDEKETPEENVADDHKKPATPWGRRVAMALELVPISRAWSVAAELRAHRKLRRHVSPVQFADYLLTGSFLESSPRSHVIYFFRKLRPTVAIKNGCILAALCSHPIGFYAGTWAGAMVPTDDVISHLLLMRGDEHRFWRISNQHAPWDVEAGL